MGTDFQWYCLRTKPKNERLAAASLRAELGLEVFCPFLRFERARRTGRAWVVEAMFPNYIFVRFDYPTQFRQVKSSRGVMKIVGFGGAPVVVAAEIIMELRSAVSDEETIVIESGLEVGEEVNLVTGPFRGLRAMVTRLMPARQRVAVLLEVLGMEREVEVAVSAVMSDVEHPMLNRRN